MDSSNWIFARDFFGAKKIRIRTKVILKNRVLFVVNIAIGTVSIIIYRDLHPAQVFTPVVCCKFAALLFKDTEILSFNFLMISA